MGEDITCFKKKWGKNRQGVRGAGAISSWGQSSRTMTESVILYFFTGPPRGTPLHQGLRHKCCTSNDQQRAVGSCWKLSCPPLWWPNSWHVCWIRWQVWVNHNAAHHLALPKPLLTIRQDVQTLHGTCVFPPGLGQRFVTVSTVPSPQLALI